MGMSRGDRTLIVMLCTGNAARSVMASIMLQDRTDKVDVIGAGTHAIEGLPMSQRTRGALEGHGLRDPGHRSRQLVAADAERAELIVAFEPDHVAYVRRHHADAADRTGMIRRVSLSLPSDDRPLGVRVAAMGLADVPVDADESVVDPAGGDERVFRTCADEIAVLIDELAPRL